MQTFLPYASFRETAIVLDMRRLGKQRVETKQLIISHLNGGGWSHHPARTMWEGHIPCLAEYGRVICEEWLRRGYRDSLLSYFTDISRLWDGKTYPDWFGNESFHASHRSNLLRKDPIWYGQFGWTESPNLPYVWPKKNNVIISLV